MKKRDFLLTTLLAVVVGIALLSVVLMRTFWPAIVIPKLTLPNLMLLSLIALVLDHYFAPGAYRCYICIPFFSAVIFGLLPWIAGYVLAAEIWKSALAGCAVFTAATWLFTSMCDRSASGSSSKAAPVISALGLYFAAQCFSGILF